MNGAYYNEIDPKAAAWLRELIKRSLIAPGEVDERSIVDIRPAELLKYDQCHFFAGIGVWSYALRLAGWDDSRPVWTGSCPCQPLSQAGKGLGFADERHLWPYWEHLIRECRPPVIFGEQVASKAAASWADLVQDDLEALDYTFGAVPFPAASVGAPHIRDRLYWLAYDNQLARRQGRPVTRRRDTGSDALSRPGSGRCVGIGGQRLAYDDARCIEHAQRNGEPQPGCETPACGNDAGGRGELGDTGGGGSGRHAGEVSRAQSRVERCLRGELDFTQPPSSDSVVGHHHHQGLEGRSLPASGRSGECTPWSASDFVWCRDGKWRPIESRPFEMVDGAAASMGRVCDSRVRSIEFEVAEWSIRYQADAGEALYDLRIALSADAQRERPTGGLPGLHEAPFLLAFLRQLTEQGWAFAERISGESTEVDEARVRVLRDSSAIACASCERGLDGQPAGERADALRILSSILACHAQAAWDHAHYAHASAGFPLIHSAPARVARLRGYGNAIVSEAAKVFIEASGLV